MPLDVTWIADLLRPRLAGSYPKLRAALLTGSVVRGTATPTSDIDVVVLLPAGAGGLRDTVEWDGRTVDVFGYDDAALARWLAADTERRRPGLCSIVLDGVLIAGDQQVADAAKRTAQEVFDAGPRACTGAELLRMRYCVTDGLLDLETSTDRAETLLLASPLIAEAVDLLFAVERRWSGNGKWLLRELRAYDPALADRLARAHDELARTDRTAALVEVLDEVLARCGGRHLVGRSDRG